MTSHRFTIPGKPIGKGRPRFSAKAGRAFTPQKTRNWEAFAAWTLREQFSGEPLRCAVVVDIVAVFPRPESKVWKTKPMPRYRHVIRPDGDNIAKAACDALEKAGVLYNDSQAWRVTVEKWVASGDEQPHLNITVTHETRTT